MSDTKILELLKNDSREYVQQGLALLQGLNLSMEETFSLLELPNEVDANNPAGFEMHFKDYPQCGFLLQELYLILEAAGVQWALDRERTYDITLDQNDGRPFTYWLQQVSKEFYDFWSANGGTDMNAPLYAFISGLTNPDYWPEDATINQDHPMTLAQARQTLKNMREDDWDLPAEIPDEGFLFPTEEGIYQFDKAGFGWVLFLKDPPAVEVQIVEKYACTAWRNDKSKSVVYRGGLKDIRDQYPNAWKDITILSGTTLREDEYFLDSFQSEKALLSAVIKHKGAFDMTKFHIQSIVDHNMGVVLTQDSLFYNGAKIEADWDCYSAQPYEPSLRKGLSHSLIVRKDDTGEEFLIDPDTKEWHLRASSEQADT